jgi:hypothetical protein
MGGDSSLVHLAVPATSCRLEQEGHIRRSDMAKWWKVTVRVSDEELETVWTKLRELKNLDVMLAPILEGTDLEEIQHEISEDQHD